MIPAIGHASDLIPVEKKVSQSNSDFPHRAINLVGCADVGKSAVSTFAPAPRLRPLQPGQTQARSAGAGLAVLVVSPLGAARDLSQRLGRRSRRRGAPVRREVMGFATGSTHPTLANHTIVIENPITR